MYKEYSVFKNGGIFGATILWGLYLLFIIRENSSTRSMHQIAEASMIVWIIIVCVENRHF